MRGAHEAAAPFGLRARWAVCTERGTWAGPVGERGVASRSHLAPLDLPSSVGFADIFSREREKGRGREQLDPRHRLPYVR
jgi:hypothetical protein